MSKSHNLEWKDLRHILGRCRKLEVLVLACIGYRKQTAVPAQFTEILNIGYLRFLELSHCKITSSLFGMLPLKCSILEMLFIDNCQEISKESYEISPFKQHEHLKLLCVAHKLLCVAHNQEALSEHCVVELLKYTSGKVLLDIRGHHFTQEDFDYITREHHDALDRIKEVHDYQNMIITCMLHR